MQVIQNDLEVGHRLRPVRNSVCPSGHPDELFHLPQLLGTHDHDPSPNLQ